MEASNNILLKDVAEVLKYYTRDEIDEKFETLNIVDKTVVGSINELKEQIGNFKLWVGTEAEYEAISEKDNHTLYFIEGE